MKADWGAEILHPTCGKWDLLLFGFHKWMPYGGAPYCSIRPEPSGIDDVRCGGHAAVDLDRCPGDVAGPWGRQESDDLGHFRGSSEPAQRQAPRYALAERGNRLGRQRELIEGGSVDGPRTERIDPNSPGRELGGQRWNERGNRALGRAVDGPAGKAPMRSDRAHEQDRSAFREKRKDLLEAKNWPLTLIVEMFVEGRFVDCLERQQAYDPGIQKAKSAYRRSLTPTSGSARTAEFCTNRGSRAGYGTESPTIAAAQRSLRRVAVLRADARILADAIASRAS